MRVLAACVVALTVVALASSAALATVPAGYTETTLAAGLARPAALAWLPGARLLIGEQYSGQIKMYKNGAVQPTPFATLAPIYTGTNETGLLGLCVDPDFAANGYVYVFATQSASVQRIWRYTAVGDVGTAPALIVDGLPTNGGWHNAGGIGFGPDGKLYVTIGENGVPTLAQSLTTYAGKILRFNPNGSIPVDNPIIPPATAPTAIWAYGLRNPFRFTFRPSNGSLILTENGPNVDDEINRITIGANYGWPADTGDNTDPAYVDPIYTFPATIAITDVMFYTGSTMPLGGEMLVCDAKFNRIHRLSLDASDNLLSGPTEFVTATTYPPIDLEQGPDGAIYYCTHHNTDGRLVRVQAASTGNFAPTASCTATPATGAPPLDVSVDASASYDVDGSIASYSWNWGDGSPAATGAAATHAYATAGAYTITLTVTDNLGATGTATQSIIASSGNLPPSAHVENFTVAGLAVTFEGHGHDDANGLTHAWDFGDGTPVVTLTGQLSDVNSTVVHGYAAAGTYTCALTVTDAGGLVAAHTASVVVNAPSAGGGGGGGGGCGLVGWEAVILLCMLRRARCSR